MDKQQVLIIDDDKDTAKFFHLVFDLLGFNCQSVYTADDGIAAMQKSVPDMLLLDLRLGASNSGEDILYRVRSDSRFDTTRVIVVTAYPVLAKAVSDMADLVLVKPVDIEQLKQLTNRLLGVEVRPRQFFFRDPTTLLFNEEFFQTRLDHAFERARRRSDFSYAVLIVQVKIDLDPGRTQKSVFLKPIYKEVAERLRKSYRPTDTLAYLSNGWYAGLHEDLNNEADVNILVDRMKKILAEPVSSGPKQYPLVIRVGAAINKPGYQKAGEILQAARRDMQVIQAGIGSDL